MMKRFALTSCVLSLAVATPETGCYFLEISGADTFSVKAQVELKPSSDLSFSVLLNAPNVFTDEIRLLCDNEAFEWDATESTITVGNEPLSPCLLQLKEYTMGLVESPVVIKYDSELKSLSANIVIPLAMEKSKECIDFNTLDVSSTETPTEPSTTSEASNNTTQQSADAFAASTSNSVTAVLTGFATVVSVAAAFF